ncbi:MAG: chromate efflux transporter [Burkholderiaceae bacterium]
MNPVAPSIATPIAPVPPAAVSFLAALKFWLKLGLISFGGPAGQIAIMQRELVDERRWISQGRFNHALNYCMLLPGPEAQQLATYIGWLMHGARGGIAAGALFVLPSLFIIIALSALYISFGNIPWVAALFYGIQCAVAALVLHALWRVGSKTLKNPMQSPILWAVALASFVAIEFFNLGFPWIVLAAGIVGWLGGKFAPAQFAGGGHGGTGKAKVLPSLIDDNTPTPPHALFKRSRFWSVVVIGLLLWALPMLALVGSLGWQNSLTQMGWFFTKAAMVTFGGAYAVLPYVNQAAVEHYGWLSAKQMMDGLALGETTPGPLIMIVAFIGYVGQAQEALRSAAATGLPGTGAVWLGAIGACIATWFTFLPSFIFILMGGPLIETTHGKLGFTAPLKAITAAVVGVIATLALLFIVHVAWPAGVGSPWARVDWVALCIIGAAAFALFRLKTNVMGVIAACALAGLLWRSLV